MNFYENSGRAPVIVQLGLGVKWENVCNLP